MKGPYTSIGTGKTPQSQPIFGSSQTNNEAGGYTWPVDDWVRLDRFLTCGTEGGAYYVGESKLTVDNAQAVARCIRENGGRVVDRVVELSTKGRLYKEDPALLVLAMASADKSLETRQRALTSLPLVCRTFTRLSHFLTFVHQFRGEGRALRRALANYYNSQSIDDLVYSALKYPQRDGWSQADVLRIAHPKTDDVVRNAVYSYIVDGVDGKTFRNFSDTALPGFAGEWEARIWAVDSLHKLRDDWLSGGRKEDLVDLIKKYRLTREMLPTDCLNQAHVWEALLDRMPIGAVIRNLGKMTNVGLLAPNSDATKLVISRLRDEKHLRGGRVHPMSVLLAAKVYQQGHGEKGKLAWTPDGRILDALTDAFHTTFGNVAPTNKRICIGVDLSGSMSTSNVLGVPNMSATEAAAAIALVIMATEPNSFVVGYNIKPVSIGGISPRQRLDDVLAMIRQVGGGGTDCAVPINQARFLKTPVDLFVNLTDNQTWYGSIHPSQAMAAYRREAGLPKARLVSVALAPYSGTITDPDDGGQINVAGLDANVVQLVTDFARD